MGGSQTLLYHGDHLPLGGVCMEGVGEWRHPTTSLRLPSPQALAVSNQHAFPQALVQDHTDAKVYTHAEELWGGGGLGDNVLLHTK